MIYYGQELYHHGIKGQRWGIRRYQNEDGSLTLEGKKRYARESREQNWEIGEDGLARSRNKKTKGEIHEADPNRWVKEDLQRSKGLVDASSNATRELYKAAQSSGKKKQKRMDLSQMSDKELRDQVNRELLERQYNDVFNPVRESKGKKYVSSFLSGVGTTLAITSSALGIALAVKELRGR